MAAVPIPGAFCPEDCVDYPYLEPLQQFSGGESFMGTEKQVDIEKLCGLFSIWQHYPVDGEYREIAHDIMEYYDDNYK